MKKHIISILILLLIALSACGQAPDTQVPANTPIVTPTPTTSATPIPPSITPYEIITSSPSETRTPVPLQTKTPETISAACETVSDLVTHSPDGHWLTKNCAGDVFVVIKKDAPTFWVVEYKQVFEYSESVSTVYVAPLYWAKDGTYLYLTTITCCGGMETYSNGNALYRMNLSNGKLDRVVGGNSNFYSFSPSERRLLYITTNSPEPGNQLVVNILDLLTGEKTEFKFKQFEQGGAVTWSPDGLKLAITTQTGTEWEDTANYAILVIDLADGSSQTIVPESRIWIKATQWSADDILTIDQEAGDKTFFDWNTRRWTTPTPAP